MGVGDLEPAASEGEEFDVFAAGAGDIDDAVADQGDAAVDHGAERRNLGAGGPGEQRAAVGDGAKDDRLAAARLDDRGGANRSAVYSQYTRVVHFDK